MKKENDLSNEVMMADILIRLRALENLLISKQIFTKEEFSAEINIIGGQIAKSILQKANVPGDLDVIIKELQTPEKKDN